jgi:hypothetical protein
MNHKTAIAHAERAPSNRAAPIQEPRKGAYSEAILSYADSCISGRDGTEAYRRLADLMGLKHDLRPVHPREMDLDITAYLAIARLGKRAASEPACKEALSELAGELRGRIASERERIGKAEIAETPLPEYLSLLEAVEVERKNLRSS